MKPQMLMNPENSQATRDRKCVGRALAFAGGAAVGNKLAKEQSKSVFPDKPSGSLRERIHDFTERSRNIYPDLLTKGELCFK